MAQVAWLATLQVLGVSLFPDPLYVASAGQVLAAPAQVSDAAIAERAGRWMVSFASFVEHARR